MMFQRYRHIAQVAAASLAISAACVVVAQQGAPPRQPTAPAQPRAVPQPQPPVQESRERLKETSGRVDTRVQATVFQRSSLLIGAPVQLAGNVRFGTVREIVISEQGCVDYLIVDYQGRFAPIPWSVMTFDPGQRIVMLDIAQTQIATIPTFTQFNQFTQPTFINQVNTFFNVDVDVRSRTRTRDGDRRRDDDRLRDSDRSPDADRTRPRDDADRPKADRPDPKAEPPAAEKTVPGRTPKAVKPEDKPTPEKPSAEPKAEPKDEPKSEPKDKPKAEPNDEEIPPPKKKTPEEQP